MNSIKKNRVNFIFLLVLTLFILPSILADSVFINAPATISAVNINNTITFTSLNITLDSSVVDDNSNITLNGVNYTYGNLQVINITTPLFFNVSNTSVDSSGFPTLILNDPNTKTINSNLSQIINMTFIITNLSNCYKITSVSSNGLTSGFNILYPNLTCTAIDQGILTAQIDSLGNTLIGISYYTDTTGGGGGGIPGTDAPGYQYNKSIICKDAYYFIIAHLNSQGNLVYSNSDLSSLSDQITTKINTKILPTDIKPYVDNYATLCKGIYTDLPNSNNTQVSLSPNQYTYANCDYKIGGNVLGLDLDSSIPFNPVQIDFSCQSIGFFKYFINFAETNDSQTYSVNGIKIIPITLIILIILVIYIIYSNRQVNKAIKKIAQ